MFGAVFAALSLKRFGFANNFVEMNIALLFGLVAIALVSNPRLVSSLTDNQLGYFLLFGASLLVLTSSFAFINISVQTLVQRSTPPEYLSRVYALVGLINKGEMSVGAYVYGLFLATIAVLHVVWLTALVMLTLLLVFSLFLLRQPKAAMVMNAK